MKCPVCGEAELVRDVRDLRHTYKGAETSIPSVTGEFCPACGEAVLDAAESTRVMSEMQLFARQIAELLNLSGG